jgi:hypothetical protein
MSVLKLLKIKKGRNKTRLRMFSGLCREVDENSALLGEHATEECPITPPFLRHG